jgi:hypothetical protein
MWVGLDESGGSINSPVTLGGTNPPWFQVENSESEFWKNVNFWLLSVFPAAICRPKGDAILVGNFKFIAPTVVIKSVTKDGKTYKVPDCSGYGPNNINSCKFDPPCQTLDGYVNVPNPAGWGLENAHFLNWIEPPFSPTVQKVWARGTEKLYAGDSIRIFIVDRFPVKRANFEKSVVISNVNWQGGRNVRFCIFCMIVGSLYVFFGIFVAVFSKIRPRKMGDSSYYNFSDPFLDARLRAVNRINYTQNLINIFYHTRTRLERPYLKLMSRL